MKCYSMKYESPFNKIVMTMWDKNIIKRQMFKGIVINMKSQLLASKIIGDGRYETNI